MSLAEAMVERKERPAYVTFHRVPMEDKNRSAIAGYYVAMDVDFVHVTPSGTKDVMKWKVPQWFDNMKRDVGMGRMPQEWVDNYKKQYDAWKNGQELPLNGTPIKAWGVISPAQQETLIQLRVLTVEDLASLTDEGIRRIGMGAVDLKNKAKAWLAQMGDKGPLTMEMAALKQENAILRGSVETLEKQVAALMQQQGRTAATTVLEAPGITATDILDDELPADQVAAYTQKFGKAPHPAMKPETLAARLKE
jgi:hypothetical protein